MINGHAIYSPSGAKKWMTCPGSIAMEAGEPNDSSEYADEGTAAHALQAMCLKDGSHPSAYLGRVLTVEKGVYITGAATVGIPCRQFIVDIDMVAAVNASVQKVREYARGGVLLVEQRVPIGHITGEDGATGTADVIIVTTDGAELQVHDLKYGVGVTVGAVKNPQGMLYLLGALEQLRETLELTGEQPPARFRFVIHQPRSLSKTLDEWDCTYDELMAFAEEAKACAGDAATALKFVDSWLNTDQLQYLVPGDHCKNQFCRARAKCPALAKFVTDTVGADFEVIGRSDKNAISPPTDLHELGQKNAAVDFILDWCKQVRAKVEATLFEYQNSVEAQTALGFKLVRGKKGNRQWKDDTEAITLLKKMRLKTEEIFDLSVKSPTAITKALKDTPKRLAKVEPLITQRDGQPSVAPLSDAREALVIKPVADAFEVTDGSDLV